MSCTRTWEVCWNKMYVYSCCLYRSKTGGEEGLETRLVGDPVRNYLHLVYNGVTNICILSPFSVVVETMCSTYCWMNPRRLVNIILGFTICLQMHHHSLCHQSIATETDTVNASVLSLVLNIKTDSFHHLSLCMPHYWLLHLLLSWLTT